MMHLKKYAASVAEKKGYGEPFKLLESVERLGVPLIMKHRLRACAVREKIRPCKTCCAAVGRTVHAGVSGPDLQGKHAD